MSNCAIGDMHLGINTLFHVPGDVGGTETYLRELLIAITQEYPRLKITIFCQRDNDKTVRKWFSGNDCVRYVCLPFRARFRPFRIIAEQVLLPWYVARTGIDLLWSPGYTAPFFSPCPQTVTVHDLQYKKHPQDLKWLERLTLDTLVKMACRRCEAIIAVSEFSRQEILRYHFAPPSKVHAVLEGVSQSFGIPVDDDSVGNNLRRIVPFEKPYILCVAHTYPHKKVHVLIEAFYDVMDTIPHNLVIVGKPRLGEPEVKKVLSRPGLSTRLFRFESGVSVEHLRFLYQKAELFVLPSEYEGFGLPVLEAMMAGTPVVCSSEASLPEVAGEHAFYVESITVSSLKQRIEDALGESVELKADRCSSSQSWAQTFTWKRAAQNTVALFQDCITK